MTDLILQCHKNAAKVTASQFSKSTPPRLLRIATTSGFVCVLRLWGLERLSGLDPKSKLPQTAPKYLKISKVSKAVLEFLATKKLVRCDAFVPVPPYFCRDSVAPPDTPRNMAWCDWPKDHECERKTKNSEFASTAETCWNYDIYPNRTSYNLGSWNIQEMQKIFVSNCDLCILRHFVHSWGFVRLILNVNVLIQLRSVHLAQQKTTIPRNPAVPPRRLCLSPWGHRTGGVRKWGSKASTGFWSNVLRVESNFRKKMEENAVKNDFKSILQVCKVKALEPSQSMHGVLWASDLWNQSPDDESSKKGIPQEIPADVKPRCRDDSIIFNTFCIISNPPSDSIPMCFKSLMQRMETSWELTLTRSACKNRDSGFFRGS